MSWHFFTLFYSGCNCRCNSSISSIWTRLCSDRNDLFDLFDLVDFADLALRVLRELCRCSKFCEIVRCKFLLVDEDALFDIQGCLRASAAVSRLFGSSTSNLSMKSFAWFETSRQGWKKQKDKLIILYTLAIDEYKYILHA